MQLSLNRMAEYFYIKIYLDEKCYTIAGQMVNK